MSTMTGLRLSVADLLRRPGSSRAIHLHEPVDGLATASAHVPGAVDLDLTLARVPEGIVVRGALRAHYAAACSRCVREVGGEVAVHVDELFEPVPLEGETYFLDHEHLDLEPMVRDNLVPELPLRPLCRPDCAGLCPMCGVDRNARACDCAPVEADDRWAPLRSLEL